MREMDLSLTDLQMKWNHMSICFVQVWCGPFLDSTMADWLSQCITVGTVGGEVSDPTRVCSHTASFVACAAATYLASMVEMVTIGCFFKLQATALPLMRNA